MFHRTVLEKGNAQLRRQLKEMLLGSLNSRCVIFYNENYQGTFKARRLSVRESSVSHQNRLFEISAKYLQRQLGASDSVTVVLSGRSGDPLCAQYPSRSDSSMQITTLEDYISSIHTTDDVLSRWRDMLHAARPSLPPVLASTQDAVTFSRHLSRAEIRAGLASGVLQCGELSIFTHSSGEGEVLPTSLTVKSHSAISAHSSVLLSGESALNRAIHGDIIVYEVGRGGRDAHSICMIDDLVLVCYI